VISDLRREIQSSSIGGLSISVVPATSLSRLIAIAMMKVCEGVKAGLKLHQ
jgi:hypothetical protein